MFVSVGDGPHAPTDFFHRRYFESMEFGMPSIKCQKFTGGYIDILKAISKNRYDGRAKAAAP